MPLQSGIAVYSYLCGNGYQSYTFGMVMLRARQGFTLIELLVVIAIIGLLATYGSSYLRSPRLKAEDTQTLANIRQITSLFEQDAVANVSGQYQVISGVDDDASWAVLLGLYPVQAGQLPAVGKGYAVKSNGSGYCLWKASLSTPANIIYCTTGAHCSEKEGVAPASLPAGCSHP
jgi:prepilin-type N-terminal cleavage/methylation domain-containing protein